MEIGKLITLQRKKLNINLEDLSERLGISISYLSRIENGKRDIPVKLVESICEILTINKDKLCAQMLINDINKKYGKSKYFQTAIKKIVLKIVEESKK